ncbi:DUF4232 domain-containing protein [Streptomyces sp. 110]|uniref:DUF4232 domain-containing protein n=1 Tax=Streptomyces endocoffeicus TaxID=2898945 RepID=A0ABS1PKI5_9ACTN|nr:DUF4232 domain-containing protein [Streptomyces endocoffeicus]MBL1112868.1 DUF4232 domain-containing protein [Streptomyces endocoffeicus]
MRIHKLTIAALAVAAGLSLTACQNDDDSAGKSDPSSASSASSSGGGSGSGGSDQGGGKDSGEQGTAAGTGSNEDGKIDKCRTDELEVTAADRTIDGDGEGTVAVTLKNGGGRDCAISGFAGVDLKTSEGALSAKRSGQPADTHILKDGESTYFGVNYPVNDSGGSGVRVTGLVVTPPNETKSVTLDWPGGGTLPVTDGSGSPVKVGPIGGIGQGG